MARGHNRPPPHRSALGRPALEPALPVDSGTRSHPPAVAKEVPWAPLGLPTGLPPSWVGVAGMSPPPRTCCPPGRGEGRGPEGRSRRCGGTEHAAYMERMGATSSREAMRIPISQMQAVSSRAHVGSPLALPWPKTWGGERGQQGSGAAVPVPHGLGRGSSAQPAVARPSPRRSPGSRAGGRSPRRRDGIPLPPLPRFRTVPAPRAAPVSPRDPPPRAGQAERVLPWLRGHGAAGACGAPRREPGPGLAG